MDCLEPAESVVIRGTVLGVLKELADAIKLKFDNPEFAVISTDDGYAVVTTTPTNALMIVLWQTWADGWITRYQNEL
jgi:hypothetical protein